MNGPAENPSAPAPKLLPNSAQTEAAVLSAWSLQDRFGRAWKPETELFYVPRHRFIAEAMARLGPDMRDEAAIFAQMETDGTLTRAGGSGPVHVVLYGAPVYGDPWPHVAKLRELKALRDLIRAAERAVSDAYQSKDLGQMVEGMQEAMRLGSADLQTTALSPADLMRAVAVEMEAQRDPNTCTTGLPTLDRDSGGFQHEQVAIFGASTHWGKSSYALFVSDKLFEKAKRPFIVSFEDPEKLYGRRLMARRANVNPNVLRNGKYRPDDAEWSRVLGVASKAETGPFFMNAIGKTVERVATDLRCILASEPIDLVIVDYLQAIESSKRHQDKKNEMSYIARTLSTVIKTSGCAGLMFSQLKRPLKAGEKPTKHSLKESGDLENAAEIVMLGFMDKDEQRIIRTEKVKDGNGYKEYIVQWDETFCGIKGEGGVVPYPGELSEGRWQE